MVSNMNDTLGTPDMDKTQVVDLQDFLPNTMKGLPLIPQTVRTRGIIQFVMITQDLGRLDIEWELPEKKIFNKVVVRMQNLNTELKNGANAAIQYTSVSGGVPIVGLRAVKAQQIDTCLLYTSPSPRDS